MILWMERIARELAVPATSEVNNPLTMAQNKMAACTDAMPSLVVEPLVVLVSMLELPQTAGQFETIEAFSCIYQTPNNILYMRDVM